MKKHVYIGVIALTLVGLYLRFNQRLHMPIDGDELYVINSLSSYESFLHFVSQLPHLEFSSYLTGDYYILYPFIKIFGANKWGVAIPHIIATVFSFYFLFKVCQLHLKNALGFFIAFVLVSLNGTLIEHSFELRYYAVLQTLGLATYYYIHLLAYRPHPLTTSKLITLGVFFCLTILFHFYSVIMVCANIAFFLAVGLHQRSLGQIIRNLTPFFAIVFLITAPILYIVLFVQFHISSAIWSNETFRYIPNPLENFIGFLKGIFGNLIGTKKLYFLLAGLMASLCLPHQERLKQWLFLLILVLLPIMLLLLLDIKAGYWFIQRQFIWVMPLLAILVAWCWESIYTLLTTWIKPINRPKES